ncbi:MAG: trimethylamine methyltransferase family protein [Anaerolineales bacterium]|nr:trimethylamine methyltransferase family protein [Chloroflexota bacterium]MBL6981068.1 trimethylamine methyltransferase family protein [Anaerolineales bacterium]
MTAASFDHTNIRSTRLRSLTKDNVKVLHEASLEILTHTGLRFFNDEAVTLFKKAGAKVSDGNLVCIPAYLVERALRSVPKSITIYDQTGKRAMMLGGHRSYYGPGSDCMHIYDTETWERRIAVLDDVVNGIRLVDALPHLDFVMSMFLPSDVPAELYERRQMALMLQESTKPIVYVGIDANSTVFAIKMAEMVAGGEDQLQRYPFVINYVNTVSAFYHNDESVQRLLYAAERNLPTIYAPSTSRGITAPITIAGALALGNAGHLGGLVLSQLKREGSPFLRSHPNGSSMDLSSMVSVYGAPDNGPHGWDLAHRYEIPTFGAAGCSDSKVFDAQAAAEASLTLFENTIGGVNLIHDVGYLDCAMTGSLEFVYFNNEIIGWLRQYMRKLEINQETLALDLIHEIGPDGSFLEADHTYNHIREEWRPTILDRLDFHRWSDQGSRTVKERANDKVKEIVASHRAEPLPNDVIQKLDALAFEDVPV